MKPAKILLIALCLVPLASCHKSQKETAQAEPVIDVASVTVDSVTVHKIYPGYLTANQTVQLVARVNGYLTSKPYKEGDLVRKGAVLYTIESSQYADAVRQAKAALNDAEATYAYASSHYAAMQKALQSNAVSQMEVLQAKSAMEAAQASIETSRAQLQSAQTTLSYCTVRAPFDGHVTMSNYSVGSYLAGAAAPVVLGTIYDDASVDVNFNVDDKDIQSLEANNANPALSADMKRIPISFDTQLPHSYYADLSYIAPAIDKSTGSMIIQATLKNPYGDLRPGMYCKIHMPSQVVDKAMLVRDASIATDQLGKYVYVVNDSNKVVYTPIKVGEVVNDTMRIVTSGLHPTDRYVTKALLKVRDGMAVKPRVVK